MIFRCGTSKDRLSAIDFEDFEDFLWNFERFEIYDPKNQIDAICTKKCTDRLEISHIVQKSLKVSVI